jgi:hypothetical protein
MKRQALHSHVWSGQCPYSALELPWMATSSLAQLGHLGPLSLMRPPYSIT